MYKHVLIVASLLALAACDDGEVLGSQPAPPAPPLPPPDYTTFVKLLFQSDTDETSEPRDISNQEFGFNDNENPEAFDDLL